jgi:hypothetical protein
MGQVLHTMRQRLPCVEQVLGEIAAIELELSTAADEGTTALQERLNSLCDGRAPVEVVAQLRAFRAAVTAGDGLKGAGLWVRVARYLQAGET